MLACGMDPKGVMAELTGRARRLFARARAARCTCSAREKNFFGGHGIVGAQVPLGTGLAFANWYRDNDSVCLTYFGDGAANQGQVYESFNMAELWKLPVVYVIENNQYAMGTSVERASAADRFLEARRALRHSRRAGRRHGRAGGARRPATRRWRMCRAGKGPIILEMKTYRYRGHSMSDPAKYRTREEVAEDAHRSTTPIEHVRHAAGRDWACERGRAQGDRRRGEARSSHDAAEFAQTSPEPDPSELWTDVYWLEG